MLTGVPPYLLKPVRCPSASKQQTTISANISNEFQNTFSLSSYYQLFFLSLLLRVMPFPNKLFSSACDDAVSKEMVRCRFRAPVACCFRCSKDERCRWYRAPSDDDLNSCTGFTMTSTTYISEIDKHTMISLFPFQVFSLFQVNF